MVQHRSDLIKGPWRTYSPGHDYGVLFIHYRGIDWYKYREFIKSKYLVVFGSTGEILDVYTDFQRAFPGDLFSAEVDEIPEDFDCNKYRFGQEGFYEYVPSEEEIRAKNERIQKSGYKRVANEINSLTMLKNIGVMSEEESLRLEELTSFVKGLREVDLLNPIWPNLPS